MGANDNRRIAKNSLFLYIQMAIRMVVGLYTTRVVLHALGEVDFGVNNVVGGFVAMFTFISDTMVSASQRFFAYELGKGNSKRLNEYFNTTVICYVIITLALLLIIEGTGVWFVNNRMKIPVERLGAANWVFQFAVISLVVHMFIVPYSSMIIAQERMVVFAIISLVDVFMKLGIVFVLVCLGGDKLVNYGVMHFLTTLVVFLINYFFCHFNFRESTRLRLYWNKSMFVEMISYSGWSLFWTSANVVRSQGINILLNLFSNPVVNTARGIAYNVNNAINQFVNSFYQAVRPHITKLSARKEYAEMMKMVFSSSKISFFLIALVAVPLLVETPYILEIWLDTYPEYTVAFTRLVIITAMIDTLGHPLTTAVCSTGRIKWFHIVCGTILLLNLPVSYLFLKLGFDMYVVFFVSIVMSSLAQMARVVFMKRMFDMDLKGYCSDVIVRSTAVFSFSFIGTFEFGGLFAESFLNLCIVVFTSFILTGIFSWIFGASHSEKTMIKGYVTRFLQKRADEKQK